MQEQTKDIESRLYTFYRLSIYAFGLLMATAILGGTWFGLRMIQRHDAKNQIKQNVKADVKRKSKIVAVKPFEKSKEVSFSLPYQHGADPNTLRIVAQLSTKKSNIIPGGFSLPGIVHINQMQHNTNLQLACQKDLCQLKFIIPSKLVLQPKVEGHKLIYPRRSFEIQADQIRFQIKESRLVSISSESIKNKALFQAPQNLDRFYKENFLNSQGEKISWKP